MEKAKQLLSAAGQEGLKFALSFSSYGDVADLAAIIKSNLAEAGITADLQPGELVTWLASYIGGGFEATTLVHLPYLSDDIQLQSHHSRGFMKNDAAYLGVDDPEVDAMLERSRRRSTTTRDKAGSGSAEEDTGAARPHAGAV